MGYQRSQLPIDLRDRRFKLVESSLHPALKLDEPGLKAVDPDLKATNALVGLVDARVGVVDAYVGADYRCGQQGDDDEAEVGLATVAAWARAGACSVGASDAVSEGFAMRGAASAAGIGADVVIGASSQACGGCVRQGGQKDWLPMKPGNKARTGDYMTINVMSTP